MVSSHCCGSKEGELFSCPVFVKKEVISMTSICDERGQELIYAGMPIFKEEIGIGGVLSLLWFQRR